MPITTAFKRAAHAAARAVSELTWSGCQGLSAAKALFGARQAGHCETVGLGLTLAPLLACLEQKVNRSKLFVPEFTDGVPPRQSGDERLAEWCRLKVRAASLDRMIADNERKIAQLRTRLQRNQLPNPPVPRRRPDILPVPAVPKPALRRADAA